MSARTRLSLALQREAVPRAGSVLVGHGDERYHVEVDLRGRRRNRERIVAGAYLPAP